MKNNETKKNGNGKNENLTELVFILDRSGSMSGLEGDVVGGFNSLIKKQKAQEGDCFVTTVLFSNDCETLHDRVPLKDVPEMRESDFEVGGCTALIDAIGGTVEHIAKIHKYARPEDVPAHVVFAIMTDGMENASRRFSSAKVKAEIEKRRAQGWEFLFLGANIDAVETAGRFGIAAEKAVNYRSDNRGTGLAFTAFSKAMGAARKGEVCAEWRDELDADFEERK
ncbi:MAG: VWA domain-containing protein [Clostridia bacterium]|nr:VWA domain-containing protein [Clostridia bacterium]